MRPSQNPQELEIVKFLTSEPLRSDTTNHCIQIYDYLHVPDEDVVIMVMPLLREYTSPAFHTVGEAMECFRQLFEVIIVFTLPSYFSLVNQGLQFMHKNRVAHR